MSEVIPLLQVHRNISRFPGLKIIIVHIDEGLAQFIDRVDSTDLGAKKAGEKLEGVWRTNMRTTTSASFSVR
jgi:hypothetical protein